jgi:hypothetical protein
LQAVEAEGRHGIHSLDVALRHLMSSENNDRPHFPRCACQRPPET